MTQQYGLFSGKNNNNDIGKDSIHSYRSYRSDGNRSVQNIRNYSVDHIGRRHDLLRASDSRKVDHVADILNRIENRIQRRAHNRNNALGERVNKLTRDNEHKDRLNRSWHSDWEERDKRSLVSNASKA